MTKEEFIQAGENLFGKQWHRPMMEGLGISEPTLYRWKRGQCPIPSTAEAAIKCWLKVDTMGRLNFLNLVGSLKSQLDFAEHLSWKAENALLPHNKIKYSAQAEQVRDTVRSIEHDLQIRIWKY